MVTWRSPLCIKQGAQYSVDGNIDEYGVLYLKCRIQGGDGYIEEF